MTNHMFDKEAHVYIVNGYERTWKTLWLIPRPKLTRVFVGYINTIYRDGWKGDVFELVDKKHRDNQGDYFSVDEVKFLRPWNYEVKEV